MPNTSPRAAVSGPQNQRKRPGDLTGVNGQKLAAERDEAQAEAVAAAQAAQADTRVEKLSTVVDYTQGGIVPEVAVVDTPDEPHAAEMIIRVNYPIEEMTFGKEVIEDAVFENGICVKPAVLGRLNVYNFEEGTQYRVPWELGLHLKRLGYVYDF